MFDLLNTDARTFLNAFKTAYYSDYCETLQIGSDEFAVASVYAYCMSIFFNQCNEYTKNRFIDSATGEFLDAIAANYGINERPTGYHASALFSLELTAQGITIPENGIVIKTSSGFKFTNLYAIKPSGLVTLQAVEAGTKYNNIPVNAINIIESGSVYITSATNTTMAMGGTDGYPYTADGDNLYREWLKTEINSFAGCGTYKAFEARALNADSRVTDSYVLRQDDIGYQKGKVQIFILTDPDTDINGQVKQIVQQSCDDPLFRPIGDLVIVDYAELDDLDISSAIQITYPKRFEGVAYSRNARILAEYKAELQAKINKPFVFEEFCKKLVEKDSDGVFALDAKPLDLDAADYMTPVYPTVGSVLNLQSVSFNTVISGRGA